VTSREEAGISRLPSSVRIGPFAYDVVLLPRIFGDDGAERTGQADMRALTLEISEAMPARRRPQTLMHEMLHAIDWSVQSGLTEEQVIQLAHALTDVFTRNPDLSHAFRQETEL
jgi:hypothetical protein